MPPQIRQAEALSPGRAPQVHAPLTAEGHQGRRSSQGQVLASLDHAPNAIAQAGHGQQQGAPGRCV